jgi:cellulose synthase/poly-beta-1,6-N-acetylglucosamine synthase-like glycosyltransferase
MICSPWAKLRQPAPQLFTLWVPCWTSCNALQTSRIWLQQQLRWLYCSFFNLGYSNFLFQGILPFGCCTEVKHWLMLYSVENNTPAAISLHFFSCCKCYVPVDIPTSSPLCSRNSGNMIVGNGHLLNFLRTMDRRKTSACFSWNERYFKAIISVAISPLFLFHISVIISW